jgi:hypothetical protein
MWKSRTLLTTHEQNLTLKTAHITGQAHLMEKGRARRCLVIAAFLVGVSLLAPANVGASTENHAAHVPLQSKEARDISKVTLATTTLPRLAGAGGIGSEPTASQLPAAPCSSPNPLDPTCWAQLAARAMAQWIAQAILSALQPLIESIDHNSLNILTQTPLLGQNVSRSSPLDATIVALWNWAIGVVDAALTIFLILGGYTIMLRSRTQEVLDVGVRLLFALVAAHFSLLFMQVFIQIENALCDGVIHLYQVTILTNTLTALLQGNLLASSLILFVLGLVLCVMFLLIVWQMLVRLALLSALVVLAGPAMLCFASRLTYAWGRLWVGLFAGTLFVQLFQVVVLALGSILVSSLSTGDLFHLDSTILTLLVSIAVFSLVLQIPGLMRQWAIRPIVQAATATAEEVQGRAEYLARTATSMALRMALL